MNCHLSSLGSARRLFSGVIEEGIFALGSERVVDAALFQLACHACSACARIVASTLRTRAPRSAAGRTARAGFAASA